MSELQNVLKRTGFPHSLIRIIAFDSNVIKRSKQLLPDIKAYWLFDWLLTDKCKNMQSVVNKLLTTLQMINADGIDMNYSTRITGEIIRKVKNEGYEIVFYDVNTPEEAQTLSRLGVDAITTNFPGKIKASLISTK
jgi:glycerophosphoryl diester phosphodiesterase